MKEKGKKERNIRKKDINEGQSKICGLLQDNHSEKMSTVAGQPIF